jgi:hypothetical protein
MCKKELAECRTCHKRFMLRLGYKSRFKDGRVPQVLSVALKLSEMKVPIVNATCDKCLKEIRKNHNIEATLKALW